MGHTQKWQKVIKNPKGNKMRITEWTGHGNPTMGLKVAMLNVNTKSY